MIELEVYAKGLRLESTLMALHGQMDLLPHIRYKIDTHHDLVYFEVDDPATTTLRELTGIFDEIGLTPRLVGQIPAELAA